MNTFKKLIIFLIVATIILSGCAFYFQNLALLLVAMSALVSIIMLTFKPVQTAGVFIIALLLSLSVAEWVAPILLDDSRKKTQYDLTHDYPYKNIRATDLGQQPYPGVHRSRKLTLKGEEIYNVSYSIGEDGFRLTTPVKVAPYRINFLGCSFTFGEGLKDNQTLPHYINSKMEDVSVKNFGFHSWGAHQALAILQSDRDTRGSINFFLTIPWHVDRSACKPRWSKGGPKYEIAADGRLVRAGKCSPLAESGWASKALGYSKMYLAIQQLNEEQSSAEDYELYFAIVKEMATLSHARGKKFIIGFIKTNEKFFGDSGFSNKLFQARLAEIADEVVDLTLAERAKDMDKKYRLHKQDTHPTALANEERAKLLVDVFDRHLH